MKVIAANLLALLGGNAHPSAADIKSILASVGAEAGEERIELLLSELKGRDVNELIAAGREKFASLSSGGGLDGEKACGAVEGRTMASFCFFNEGGEVRLYYREKE